MRNGVLTPKGTYNGDQGARSQWDGQFLIFRGQMEDIFVFFVLF